MLRDNVSSQIVIFRTTPQTSQRRGANEQRGEEVPRQGGWDGIGCAVYRQHNGVFLSTHEGLAGWRRCEVAQCHCRQAWCVLLRFRTGG